MRSCVVRCIGAFGAIGQSAAKSEIVMKQATKQIDKQVRRQVAYQVGRQS